MYFITLIKIQPKILSELVGTVIFQYSTKFGIVCSNMSIVIVNGAVSHLRNREKVCANILVHLIVDVGYNILHYLYFVKNTLIYWNPWETIDTFCSLSKGFPTVVLKLINNGSCWVNSNPKRTFRSRQCEKTYHRVSSRLPCMYVGLPEQFVFIYLFETLVSNY